MSGSTDPVDVYLDLEKAAGLLKQGLQEFSNVYKHGKGYVSISPAWRASSYDGSGHRAIQVALLDRWVEQLKSVGVRINGSEVVEAKYDEETNSAKLTTKKASLRVSARLVDDESHPIKKVLALLAAIKSLGECHQVISGSEGGVFGPAFADLTKAKDKALLEITSSDVMALFVKKEPVAETTSGTTGSLVPATVSAETLDGPVLSEIDFGVEVRELEAYETLEGVRGLNTSDLVAQMQANILGSAANFNDLFAGIFKPAYAAVATGSSKAGRSGAAAAGDRVPSMVCAKSPVPPPARNSSVRVTKAASKPARKNAPSAPAVVSAVPATAPAIMTMSWLQVASGDKDRPQTAPAAAMVLPASPAPSPTEAAEAMPAPSADAEKGEWEVVKRKGKGRLRDKEAARAIEQLAGGRGAQKSDQTSMPMKEFVVSGSGPRKRSGRGKGGAGKGYTPV